MKNMSIKEITIRSIYALVGVLILAFGADWKCRFGPVYQCQYCARGNFRFVFRYLSIRCKHWHFVSHFFIWS